MICICQQKILFGQSNLGRRDGQVMWFMPRSACKLLMGKPQGRRPLAQTRPRWGENISMILKEIGKAIV